MTNRIRQVGRHALYVIVSNTVFGLVYYVTFTWLIGYSLLYAYAGSLALIVLGIQLDRPVRKAVRPEAVMADLSKLKEKDREKNYRLVQWFIASFVSFKTVLFVFYFLILVVSQVINIAPDLAGAKLSNFVLANNYGIVLLIAFDRIAGQFAKDRKEMAEVSAALQKSWTAAGEAAGR